MNIDGDSAAAANQATTLSEETNLSSLKQQRSSVKRNITNMKLKVEKDGERVDSTILECRLQIMESYFKHLSHIQTQIEKLNPNDNSRGDLEELFIVAKAKIMSLLNAHRRFSTSEQTLNNTFAGVSHYNRLPSLKLPRFDGKYAEFKRFFDAFSNMVHHNTTISSVDKFNYLLNCLSGPALAVVEAFPVSEENYPKALERLKERYDNDVLIFLDNISSLFNLPNMEKSNADSLRYILDTVSALRGSLLSIGSELDIMNSTIIHIVLSKLDAESKSSYDEKQDFSKLPSWDDCYRLLNRRCQFLESHGKKVEPSKKAREVESKAYYRKPSHTFVNSKTNCAYCKSSEHALSSCSSFTLLPVSQRFDFVKRSGFCINCLRKGHTVSKCQSQSRCRVCHFSHHTLLHVFAPIGQPQTVPDSSKSEPSQQQRTENAPVSFITRSSRKAFIPTALVFVKDTFGIFQPVRALLDSCSELNFITEETAKRLHLHFQHNNHEVSGIADVRTKIKYSVYATVKSRVSAFEWSSIFAVTKTISSKLPGEYVNTNTWSIPEGIELADPLFYRPQKIDLLISTEIFFDLLTDGKISLGEGMPCLVNSVFGWIVGGKFDSQTSSRPLTCNVAIDSSNVDFYLERFWAVEEYTTSVKAFSEEQTKCEKHFTENVSVRENGRIQVRLPFKEPPETLGESFETARRRFFSLERRLQGNQTTKQMYVDFMNEYKTLGHMSPVNIDLIKPHYFIPHHCVLRPQSETTKLRVVFDASARTSSNRSLNDILMVGPTIQQDLITTLFSFRLHKYALTADISKMYRQFLVDERDRKFQLILWRNEIEAELQAFQLNTVTYGVSAAPFLAIRSLHHIADINSATFPVGAQMLREDLYVDDLLTGAENLNELQQKRDQITAILATAGLQLAKWNTNHAQLFLSSDDEIQIKTSDQEITKALGMSWKPRQDTFCFRFDLPDVQNPTKRSILSIVARVFDLLGLLSPIVIRCKILLQQIWIQHIGWDDLLSDELIKLWIQIKEDLVNINRIEIPRYVLTSRNNVSELHGFADASQRAYGCCIYLRTMVNDAYKVTLVIAKSKVAPIKAQSLPRLELCAAVLLSKTRQKVKPKIATYVSNTFFWTDSKIVLQWLKMHSSSLNCFVANRISELQECTRGVSWRHVPSKNNPADIVSRGCSALELVNTIWFSGPNFLLKEFTEWPNDTNNNDKELVGLEGRKMVTFKVSNKNNAASIINEVISQNSSYFYILRTLSYIFRVFNKEPCNTSLKVADIIHLSHKELENTFWRAIAEIQRSEYEEEIRRLRDNKMVKSNSLQRLAPFLHEMKIDRTVVCILRSGGRLSNAPIPYDAKFPAIIPKDHRFTKLYLEYLHRNHLHAGPKVLLAILRQKLWVINAKDLIRKVVRSCVHCFHYKPKLMGQIMGNLPADRLRAQRPFLVSGVDFCGPFYTTYRIRGKPPYKTYMAVFVCFASKATHLELVSDLSSNNFLLCLKRFIGRRGIPHRLYCDNATNFSGTQTLMREVQQRLFQEDKFDDIISYSNKVGFEFAFIPPRAPHFGGLWEAAVKSAKTLLIKNLSQANLTFEELQTVLVEVEAILNSHPIAPMSDDPNDGEALTPAHLLIGSSLVAIPTESYDCIKMPLLNRWQRVTFLKQQFWKLWQRDYILSLQQRSKWFKPAPNIEVGQMVIIHDDNAPPQQWTLARVTQAIAGADGKVRVVDLKTSKGEYRRPIQKVAPLPHNEDS